MYNRTGYYNVWTREVMTDSDARATDNHRPPSRAAIRAMAHDVKPGEFSFICPDCHTRFKLSYGVFVRHSHFGEDEMHCKDCIEKPGHIDPRKL